MPTVPPFDSAFSAPPPGWQHVLESAAKGELVAIMGTGVSLSLTSGKIRALSWKGLVEDGLAHAVKKSLITEKQAAGWLNNQLASDDLDDLLSAAEFVGRKLGAPKDELYQRWLEGIFSPVKPDNDAMRSAVLALHRARVPLVTLNYDHLLESVTGLPAITLSPANRPRVTAWMRRDSQHTGILHLHGSYTEPATCVLGIRDYDKTTHDSVRHFFQTDLAAIKRLLFIGCGDTLADPNFSALITWLRQHLPGSSLQHYVLVEDGDLARRHGDKAWHGFAEPLSYGTGHAALPGGLLERFEPLADSITKSASKSAPASAPPAALPSGPSHEELIKGYMQFLISDCGQLTLEGMPTDYDLGRQRFDLERLFVPLDIKPCLPDDSGSMDLETRKRLASPYLEPLKSIPINDISCLSLSHEINTWKLGIRSQIISPASFGVVFSKYKHLALLALPGGGKTILLKRLAIAYADRSRRPKSNDKLPNLDLIPVVIRCREWREHIQFPLPTLLKHLPDIIGHPDLEGLHQALMPLFASGQILLLVDGLDEIHDDVKRATFVNHLEAFIQMHSRTRLVVTSREAGFSLVAPTLSRFCTQWNIAPLDSYAIEDLCRRWRTQMMGETAEAVADIQSVLDHLISTAPLQRLAENPLLLTMLLVVRQNAGGRLPLNRVNLYDRAVEVLLDTWNIKGHAPLSLKEAIPQLAYVAYEMMRAGKQTITEPELLQMLVNARHDVHQAKLYAQSPPDAFLRRVEVRSSLLVQAGYQRERGQTVPIYQFRHLTFQEYLAAVAAADGHYRNHRPNHSVLNPLNQYLLSNEWKEVIPMAAVLAGKDTEKLIIKLTRLAIRQDLGSHARQTLINCFKEEAQSTPTVTSKALSYIAQSTFYCQFQSDAGSLGNGLYKEHYFQQCWRIYLDRWHPLTSDYFRYYYAAIFKKQRFSSDPLNLIYASICANVASVAWEHEIFEQASGPLPIMERLTSDNDENLAKGLLIVAGICLRDIDPARYRNSSKHAYQQVPDRCLSRLAEPIASKMKHRSNIIVGLAVWSWSLLQRRLRDKMELDWTPLDLIVQIWARTSKLQVRNLCCRALLEHAGLARGTWKPALHPEVVRAVLNMAWKPWFNERMRSHTVLATLVVATHMRTLWSDADTLARVEALGEPLLAEERQALCVQLSDKGGPLPYKRRRARFADWLFFFILDILQEHIPVRSLQHLAQSSPWLAKMLWLGDPMLILLTTLTAILVLVLAIYSEWRSFRLRLFAADFPCLACRRPLGRNAVRHADRRWKGIKSIADEQTVSFSQERFVRASRDLHSICPACGCEHTYSDMDRTFLLRKPSSLDR